MVFLKPKQIESSTEDTPNIDKTTRKERRKEQNRIRSVQNAFDYKVMNRDGLCILSDDLYSRSIEFSDTNFQLLSEEGKYKVFGEYMALLNTAAADRVDLQLTVNNRILDRQKFDDEMLIHLQHDGLDKLRFEMNDQRRQALEDGNNKIASQKIFTISGQYTNADNAVVALNKASADIERSLNKMGCETRRMSGLQRLEAIYSAIKPGEQFMFEYENLGFKDSTKNHIAPYSIDFKAAPDYFIMDGRYCQGLYLSEYPTSLSDAFFQELITMEHNCMISVHMSMVPRKKAIEHIRFQQDDMYSVIERASEKISAKGGAGILPSSMTAEYDDAQQLLDKILKQNQNLFKVQVVILTNSADLAAMNAVRKDIENIGQSHMCKFLPMTFEQEAAFNAALPLGKPKEKLGRSMITSVCAILMPFTTKEMHDSDSPVYYGINKASHNMILGNRRLLPNPSGFILGKPGFGKSFSAKLESMSVMLSNPDADIFFIDPQGEYTFMAEELNKISHHAEAAVLKVDSYSDLHFNPFAGDPSDPDFIQRKSKYLEFLVAEMIGKGELHPQERTQIGKVCLELFNEYRDAWRNDPDVLPPTLKDFAAKMAVRANENPYAENIYGSLWSFVDGSSNLFSQQGNVDMNSSFLVFDIHDLDESIRTLSMKVILETLQQRIKKNHELGKPTYVYIDEIYLLLKDRYSEQFLYEFWKWCRKFGAIVTGITQNVTELLCSQQACTMLSNSEFCIMLGQSQNDVASLKELFRLSNMEEDELLYAHRGEGLIKFGQTIIPFENHFPKNTELYRIWNTDPSEKELSDPSQEPASSDPVAAELSDPEEQAGKSVIDTFDEVPSDEPSKEDSGKTEYSHPYYLGEAILTPPKHNSQKWED